tara:strand:- start:181 stop:462 length:282 start_codon:yes stop_codon:yes gene_type:complete
MKIRELSDYFFGTENYKFHKNNKDYVKAVSSLTGKTSLTLMSAVGLSLIVSGLFDNPQEPMKYIFGATTIIGMELFRYCHHKEMKKERIKQRD